jgi:hypothetical protein
VRVPGEVDAALSTRNFQAKYLVDESVQSMISAQAAPGLLQREASSAIG